jgi:microsomal dipeptidase-like Zn-dependent dipeptidase
MTHVENNAFADSSTSKVGPVHGGLSSLGKAAIKEMNRIGEYLPHALRVSRSLQNDY